MTIESSDVRGKVLLPLSHHSIIFLFTYLFPNRWKFVPILSLAHISLFFNLSDIKHKEKAFPKTGSFFLHLNVSTAEKYNQKLKLSLFWCFLLILYLLNLHETAQIFQNLRFMMDQSLRMQRNPFMKQMGAMLQQPYACECLQHTYYWSRLCQHKQI